MRAPGLSIHNRNNGSFSRKLGVYAMQARFASAKVSRGDNAAVAS